MRQARRFLGIWTLGLLTFLAIAPSASAQARTVTLTLSAQNASGVAGTVTLTDLGNNTTRVVVSITPATGDHPAHIHLGSCANLNPAPEFPLSNVQNGTSTTVVNQALTTIQGRQRAINLHLSPTEVATYIACADIPVFGTQAPNAAPAAAPQPTATPAAAVSPDTAVAPVQLPAALPQTGALPDPTLALVGAGLALLTAGLGLSKRFRRRRHE